ncbi:hypothetical protein [Aurantiacibacter luteus]|uniref:Uncharacterized protein n=1 Tax=Aurantiacibacter luteus TaxID=1581420 RepID=A0A0G9MP26_9SPHN|nr:hypothetical protein [Aurantiacibacter luteus]KLE32471.1 hypothetical protein AAW00_13690 [Aurantiacibacter luteus]
MVVLVPVRPNLSWAEEILAWLSICAAADDAAEQADCLRFVASSFRQAPAPVRGILGRVHDGERFDFLLGAGALHSAAALLYEEVAFGYMTSCSSSGRVMATVVLAASEDEVHFACCAEPLAVVACLAKALAQVSARQPEAMRRAAH